MASVVLTYFRMIVFPHIGGIVSIDQLTFFFFDSLVTRSVPLMGKTPHPYQHARVGLLKDSSLMGTFSLPPPSLPNKSISVSYINMIYSCTTLADPWIETDEYNIESFNDYMPLNPIELDYEAIYSVCVVNFALSSSINWVDLSLDYDTSFKYFSFTFPIDESIMEIIILDDFLWDNHRHCSSILDFFEDNIIELY